MQLRKAVFPVAGLGTRFLPATKSIPKEMLPIVDRPIGSISFGIDLVAGRKRVPRPATGNTAFLSCMMFGFDARGTEDGTAPSVKRRR